MTLLRPCLRKNGIILLRDELNPMFNRSSLGTYPPGSIFKLIVSITALNEKILIQIKNTFVMEVISLVIKFFIAGKKEDMGLLIVMKLFLCLVIVIFMTYLYI